MDMQKIELCCFIIVFFAWVIIIVIQPAVLRFLEAHWITICCCILAVLVPVLLAKTVQHVIRHVRDPVNAEKLIWQIGSSGMDIARIAWYTRKISGILGLLGVKHSLICVTLEDGAQFIIEKARPPDAGTSCPAYAENGVYVSGWSTKLESVVSLYKVSRHVRKWNNLTRRASTLIDKMISSGPYDVHRNNCHHNAMEIFNMCVEDNEQVSQLPNAWLVWLVWLFSDKAQSTVSESESSGVSSVSQSRYVDGMRVEDEPGREQQKAIVPSTWCVTPAQFEDFMKEVEQKYPGNQQPNAYQVRESLIEPITRVRGLSYALCKKQHGVQITYFVSHWWAYPIKRLAAAIRRVWLERGRGNIWICFLSNPQTWAYEELNELLGITIWQTPFAIALRQAQALIIVRDAEYNLCERLWCVLELILAEQWKKDIWIVGPNPQWIRNSRMGLDAVCTDHRDRKMIDGMVLYSMDSQEHSDQAELQSPTVLLGTVLINNNTYAIIDFVGRGPFKTDRYKDRDNGICVMVKQTTQALEKCGECNGKGVVVDFTGDVGQCLACNGRGHTEALFSPGDVVFARQTFNVVWSTSVLRQGWEFNFQHISEDGNAYISSGNLGMSTWVNMGNLRGIHEFIDNTCYKKTFCIECEQPLTWSGSDWQYGGRVKRQGMICKFCDAVRCNRCQEKSGLCTAKMEFEPGETVFVQSDVQSDVGVVVRQGERGIVHGGKEGSSGVLIKFDSNDKTCLVPSVDMDKLCKARIGDRVASLSDYDYEANTLRKGDVGVVKFVFPQCEPGARGGMVLCEFPDVQRPALCRDHCLEAKYQGKRAYVSRLCLRVAESPENFLSWSTTATEKLGIFFSFFSRQKQKEDRVLEPLLSTR